MRKLEDKSVVWHPAAERNWIILLLFTYIELLEFKSKALLLKAVCQPSNTKRRNVLKSIGPEVNRLHREMVILQEMAKDRNHDGWKDGEGKKFITSIVDETSSPSIIGLETVFLDSAIVNLPLDGLHVEALRRKLLDTQRHLISKFRTRLINAENDYLGFPVKVGCRRGEIIVKIGEKLKDGSVVEQDELQMGAPLYEDDIYALIRGLRKVKLGAK